MRRFTIRINEKIIDTLEKVSKERNISLNKYINDCIAKSFNKKEKKKNEITFECSQDMMDYYADAAKNANVSFSDYINVVLMQRYVAETKNKKQKK
jgi:predicted HicB family RNase H-like nuclease